MVPGTLKPRKRVTSFLLERQFQVGGVTTRGKPNAPKPWSGHRRNATCREAAGPSDRAVSQAPRWCSASPNPPKEHTRSSPLTRGCYRSMDVPPPLWPPPEKHQNHWVPCHRQVPHGPKPHGPCGLTSSAGLQAPPRPSGPPARPQVTGSTSCSLSVPTCKKQG